MPTLADAIQFFGVTEADVLASAVREDAVVIVLRDGRKLTYRPETVEEVESTPGAEAELPLPESDEAPEVTIEEPNLAPKIARPRRKKTK